MASPDGPEMLCLLEGWVSSSKPSPSTLDDSELAESSSSSDTIGCDAGESRAARDRSAYASFLMIEAA
jgi:hypothetical protein